MCKLTEDEARIVPIILKGFESHQGKANAITGAYICSRINRPEIMKDYFLHKKITGPGLRKIISHIRINALAPIIATQDGYYLSYNDSDIKEQIDGLRGRIAEMEASIKGLASMRPIKQEKLDI